MKLGNSIEKRSEEDIKVEETFANVAFLLSTISVSYVKIVK